MKTEQPVSEIMTRELITVRPDDTLDKVNFIFGKHKFHHIPVVNAGGKLAGIVSKEDVLSVYRNAGNTVAWSLLDSQRVDSFMTSDPITIDPDDTIGLAGDIIVTNLFHSLPVVEDGTLLGLVTSMDVLNALLEDIGEDDDHNQELPEKILGTSDFKG